ncbi:serine protease, putative, partial [Ixodes scapularis]
EGTMLAACMDGFLLGACCKLPEEVNATTVSWTEHSTHTTSEASKDSGDPETTTSEYTSSWSEHHLPEASRLPLSTTTEAPSTPPSTVMRPTTLVARPTTLWPFIRLPTTLKRPTIVQTSTSQGTATVNNHHRPPTIATPLVTAWMTTRPAMIFTPTRLTLRPPHLPSTPLYVQRPSLQAVLANTPIGILGSLLTRPFTRPMTRPVTSAMFSRPQTVSILPSKTHSPLTTPMQSDSPTKNPQRHEVASTEPPTQTTALEPFTSRPPITTLQTLRPPATTQVYRPTYYTTLKFPVSTKKPAPGTGKPVKTTQPMTAATKPKSTPKPVKPILPIPSRPVKPTKAPVPTKSSTKKTTPRPAPSRLPAQSPTTSWPSGSTLTTKQKLPVKGTTVNGSVTPTETSPLRWDYRKHCGVRPLRPQGRIVGGRNSFFGEWPWQVLVKEATWLGLFIKNKCGGVLISSKYALTAAHCQPGFLSSLLVVLGEHDLSGDYETMKPVSVPVRRMVVHRNYNPATFENDLALLELERPVTFQPHIVPICLPGKNEDFTGRTSYVTGWGKLSHGGSVPNVLQYVQVPILSNNRCQKMFMLAGHVKAIRDNFVCAGYDRGNRDSCEVRS